MTMIHKDKFITLEMMREKAGINTYSYFLKNFPNGVRYEEIYDKYYPQKAILIALEEIERIVAEDIKATEAKEAKQKEKEDAQILQALSREDK